MRKCVLSAFVRSTPTMTKDECYRLGKITKPFGYKGQVVFFLDVDSPEDYAGLDSVFVEVKGTLVPYFLSELKLNGDKAVVLFEDLSADEALALVGCNLYLPLSLLPELTGNHFYFHEVKGWQVVDREKGNIGYIGSILEYPAQPIFQIFQNETEILIPVVDEVIEKVDREEKIMYIKAPNGLIDLYL